MERFLVNLIEINHKVSIPKCFSWYRHKTSKFLNAKLTLQLIAIVFCTLKISTLQASENSSSIQAQLPNQNLNAPENLDYTLRAGIGGLSLSNEREQAQSAVLQLTEKSQYKLLQNLEFKTSAMLILQNSHTQSIYTDAVPKPGFTLLEAIIQYKTENFGIGGGAVLPGQYIQLPMLISNDRAFPGFQETFKFKDNSQLISAYAMQMIATSSNFSAKTTEQEATPSILIEGLKYQYLLTKQWLIEASGGFFQFNQLTSSIANDSGTFGNSVIESGPNTSLFEYGFSGYFGGLETSFLMFGNNKFTLFDHVILNSQAPSDSNLGQYVGARAEIKAGNSVTVAPSAGYFFNESDTVPAAFNSGEFGHNNSQGYFTSNKLIFNKSKLFAQLDYFDADVINPNATQSRQQFLFLKFVTEYGNAKLY